MARDKFVHLALGDSYTIGEAVGVDQRWPNQLTERLRKNSIKIDQIIVADTGWTTDELKSGIMKTGVNGTYDLVSLLIGVNNQYRGYPMAQYEREFENLLDMAIKFAGGNPYHVFIMSIPDYGVTPFAKNKMLDIKKISHELDNYNAVAEKIATLRNVKFINITSGSRKAKDDLSLIASDELHPSGRMYKMWVDQVYDYVHNNLSSR